MKSFPDLSQLLMRLDEKGLSFPPSQINHLCKFTTGLLSYLLRMKQFPEAMYFPTLYQSL